MEYKIRVYLDELFASAPNTQKAYEMKVELTENLIEKYNDYIAEGRTEEDAYNLTILSIGDVGELFASLQETPVYVQDETQGRRVAATFTAIGVMLYILSIVPLVLFGFHTFSLIVMLVLIALATGIVVYAQMSKPKSYQGEDVVSDFRNWQEKKDMHKRLKRSISSALWPLILVLYFLISFGTGKWYITWVIFLIGAAVEGILSSVLNLQDTQNKK